MTRPPRKPPAWELRHAIALIGMGWITGSPLAGLAWGWTGFGLAVSGGVLLLFIAAMSVPEE